MVKTLDIAISFTIKCSRVHSKIKRKLPTVGSALKQQQANFMEKIGAMTWWLERPLGSR